MNISEDKISGQIVDVIRQRIFSGSLLISDGKILDIVEEQVESSNFIIPGFVDAHVHIESSLLIPTEFARLAVCQGTVAAVSDPHEIANVMGIDGITFMIENGKKVPFKFFFGAPSCVPATEFETAGAIISASQIDELLGNPDMYYLAEMMNYPGVLHDDKQVLAKIRSAHKHNKVVDGHAPSLRGADAKKYFDAGISTDHECYTEEEGREKIELGMKVIIREGSAAKNFEALIPLLSKYPDHIMFCTDDAHPNYLVHGHINKLAARAIAAGCDIWHVLVAVSKNPIVHYGLSVGMLQKGDNADFCIVRDLKNFDCISTFVNGRKVFGNSIPMFDSIPQEPLNHFNSDVLGIEQLQIESTSNNIRVIVVEDGQLVTKHEITPAKILKGKVVSDPENDTLKLVVVNRYHNSQPAIAFVKGFGFKHGAIASSVAHDCHNVIAVGVNDEDLIKAINKVIEHKGGLALVGEGDSHFIPLPYGGLMTNTDGFRLAEDYDVLQNKSNNLGTHLHDPFMTLSFCALLVIPSLKLSDRGLFDGDKFEFVSVNA